MYARLHFFLVVTNCNGAGYPRRLMRLPYAAGQGALDQGLASILMSFSLNRVDRSALLHRRPSMCPDPNDGNGSGRKRYEEPQQLPRLIGGPTSLLPPSPSDWLSNVLPSHSSWSRPSATPEIWLDIQAWIIWPNSSRWALLHN